MSRTGVPLLAVRCKPVESALSGCRVWRNCGADAAPHSEDLYGWEHFGDAKNAGSRDEACSFVPGAARRSVRLPAHLPGERLERPGKSADFQNVPDACSGQVMAG
jgi:hypothetical protein